MIAAGDQRKLVVGQPLADEVDRVVGGTTGILCPRKCTPLGDAWKEAWTKAQEKAMHNESPTPFEFDCSLYPDPDRT